MQLGNFWMWAAAAPAGYALGRRWQTPVAWSSSVLTAWLGAKVVKNAVRRGRPIEFVEGTHIREKGITGQGYVSGHSAIAFALATAAWPDLPPGWRVVPIALASAVGVSRLYVGAHLPLDVIGGAGLGVLCALSTSVAVGFPDHGARMSLEPLLPEGPAQAAGD